jgi:hypothetical protein
MSEETRSILRTSGNMIYWDWDNEWISLRVRFMFTMFLSSPDFVILK